MYDKPLSSDARRQLFRIAGGIIVGALAFAPFLWAQGEVGKFLWSCLVLCGIIYLGQRQDALHEAEGGRCTRANPKSAPGRL